MGLTKETIDFVYQTIVDCFLENNSPVSLIKIKNRTKLDSTTLKWIIKSLLSDRKIEEVNFQHFKPLGLKIPISWDGKYCGTLIGTEFHTKRTDLHIFRRFNAFGISQGVIDKLKKLGCRKIIFEYEGNIFKKGKYEANLEDFDNSSLSYENENDLQKFVPISKLKMIY
jgi:hypothetical protein